MSGRRSLHLLDGGARDGDKLGVGHIVSYKSREERNIANIF